MLASDVWIEQLAILSHEDAYNSVDPLSSEDVAVVVDFHWFTDCHLEAIFSMNSSRLDSDLRLPSTGKMSVWSPAFLLEPGSTRYSSAPSITTVWSNYQTLYNDFFKVYITETVSYHLIFKRSTNSQQCHVTSWKSVIPIIISMWYSDISWRISAKPIDDHRQQLSFNAKLACNK